MKRRDFFILLTVLLVGLGIFLLRQLLPAPKGTPMLRITVKGALYAEIPLDHTEDYLLTQPDGPRNLISIFPGGFRMKESSCPNQDCIHQGEVTTRNMDSRPLFQQVVCLPNQVVLELIWEDAPLVLEAKP